MCFAEVFVKFWVFQPNRETDNNTLRALIVASTNRIKNPTVAKNSQKRITAVSPFE